MQLLGFRVEPLLVEIRLEQVVSITLGSTKCAPDLRHAHVKVVHQRRGQVVGGRERLLPLDLLLLFPHLLAGLVLLH